MKIDNIKVLPIYYESKIVGVEIVPPLEDFKIVIPRKELKLEELKIGNYYRLEKDNESIIGIYKHDYYYEENVMHALIDNILFKSDLIDYKIYNVTFV